MAQKEVILRSEKLKNCPYGANSIPVNGRAEVKVPGGVVSTPVLLIDGKKCVRVRGVVFWIVSGAAVVLTSLAFALR